MKNINIEVAKDFWEDVLYNKYNEEIKEKGILSIINDIKDFWNIKNKDDDNIRNYNDFMIVAFDEAEHLSNVLSDILDEETTLKDLPKKEKKAYDLLSKYYETNDIETLKDMCDQVEQDFNLTEKDIKNMDEKFNHLFYNVLIERVYNIVVNDFDVEVSLKNRVDELLTDLTNETLFFDEKGNINGNNFIDSVWQEIVKISEN